MMRKDSGEKALKLPSAHIAPRRTVWFASFLASLHSARSSPSLSPGGNGPGLPGKFLEASHEAAADRTLLGSRHCGIRVPTTAGAFVRRKLYGCQNTLSLTPRLLTTQ